MPINTFSSPSTPLAAPYPTARALGLLLGLLLSLSAVEGAETSSALESAASGWVEILPSADLNGWSRVPVPPTGKLGRDQWHVDTQTKLLVCDGDGGHDMLLWDRELGDAIFHFEFRYTKVEGKTGYNSGAYIRNSSDGAIWHQAQFGDAKDGFLLAKRSPLMARKGSLPSKTK